MSTEHLVCETRGLPAGMELVMGGTALGEIGAGAAVLQSWAHPWPWLQAAPAMWSVEMSFWGHQLLQVALKGVLWKHILVFANGGSCRRNRGVNFKRCFCPADKCVLLSLAGLWCSLGPTKPARSSGLQMLFCFWVLASPSIIQPEANPLSWRAPGHRVWLQGSQRGFQ